MAPLCTDGQLAFRDERVQSWARGRGDWTFAAGGAQVLDLAAQHQREAKQLFSRDSPEIPGGELLFHGVLVLGQMGKFSLESKRELLVNGFQFELSEGDNLGLE